MVTVLRKAVPPESPALLRTAARTARPPPSHHHWGTPYPGAHEEFDVGLGHARLPHALQSPLKIASPHAVETSRPLDLPNPLRTEAIQIDIHIMCIDLGRRTYSSTDRHQRSKGSTAETMTFEGLCKLDPANCSATADLPPLASGSQGQPHAPGMFACRSPHRHPFRYCHDRPQAQEELAAPTHSAPRSPHLRPRQLTRSVHPLRPGIRCPHYHCFMDG